jgi:cyclic AMP-dependent transcription factor ATF-4
MSDLMSGVSPDLLLLGHEEEIENQVSEILLQDFNDFQKFALSIQQQEDGFNNKKDLMEEATNDMFFPSAKPSDITGQTLAVAMETDKTKVLNSMAIPSTNNVEQVDNSHVQKLTSNWMESTTVDLEPSTDVQSTGKDGIHETQEVIEEIQEFLDQFTDDTMDQNEEIRSLADELLSEGQRATLQAMDVSACPLANSTMSEEDYTAAEDLLDHLIQGNFTSEEIKELEQSANDTGYSSTQPSFNVSNVSEFVTEDGQNIIIVIAPSSTNEEQAMSAAPTTPNGTNEVLASLNVPVSETSYQQTDVEVSDNDESNNSSGEDSDWMPDHEITTTPRSQSKTSQAKTYNKPGRRLKERTTSSTSSVSNGRVNKIKTIKDRKERKKMQNVEAARRYRDKKKAEESRVGDEERKLLKKNSELKETLNGVEGELNTIKKLMKELGLIKLVTPTTASHAK